MQPQHAPGFFERFRFAANGRQCAGQTQAPVRLAVVGFDGAVVQVDRRLIIAAGGVGRGDGRQLVRRGGVAGDAAPLGGLGRGVQLVG